MLDQDLNHANDRPSTLDRVWAATRPPELSTEEFDRMWVDVQQAYDSPSSLPMTAPARARSSRRALAWGSLILAQAAAVLLAVVMVPRPVGPEGEKPLVGQVDNLKNTPKLVRHDFEAETDAIMVIITRDDGTVEQVQIKQVVSTALPFDGQVALNNHNDTLNSWEALSQ